MQNVNKKIGGTMSARGFLVKYNYLIRTVASLCLALYIPLIIFGFTVIRSSYMEMVRKNENYYLEVTRSFAMYFDQQVTNLREHALKIALENSESDSKISRAEIESHPYYYFSATKTLSEYKMGFPGTIDLGLYFIGSDYLITSSFKYTTQDFLQTYQIDSDRELFEINKFLTHDNSRISFFSTFDNTGSSNARLFIGTPVIINKLHKAVIFNILKQDSISTSFFDSKNPNPISLCIYDLSGNLVYTNKLIDSKLFEDPEFILFLQDTGREIFKTIDYKNNYTVFKASNVSLGKVFLSIVPQYQLEEDYTQFYLLSRNITILISIVMFMLLIAIAYLNYKPILKIIKNIRRSSEEGITDEINTITHAFDRMEGYVSEQKLMLMDYFLNNLLYGISIPREDAERLDINLMGGFFCVLTVPDLKMNTKERESLALYIRDHSDANVYITDIFRKNHLVIICVLKSSSSDKAVKALKQYISKNYDLGLPTGVGHVVEKLDDIRKSYMNALHTMESVSISGTISSVEIPYISNYPAEDISTFIQSVQNGNADDAMKKLSSIIKSVSTEIETSLIQRYICYDILIAYIKCLKQINYPLGEKETLDLLSHCNVNELLESLNSSIKLVCDSINQSNNTVEYEIIDYVNKNFNDQEICRTQVADKYGISIYTLSRLFKDKTGIGFKEYINAKRMEMARQLLITTDKTISEISSEVGFVDPDYFSKQFKANYEVTPSKFRE